MGMDNGRSAKTASSLTDQPNMDSGGSAISDQHSIDNGRSDQPFSDQPFTYLKYISSADQLSSADSVYPAQAMFHHKTVSLNAGTVPKWLFHW